MQNLSGQPGNRGSSRDLLTPVFLALITFIAHFWYFRSFGIYEDDWYQVPRMFWSWGQIGSLVVDYLSSWPDGRPLHYILPITIGGLNAKWGGLPGIYLGGFLIVVVNVLLFYYLVKRCLPQISAVTAALLFCLFPADTTKSYINHFHSFQTSLLFLLLASLCYLTRRRVLSYFIICGSLFTYETAFLPFFAVPLLDLKWNKDKLRQLVGHGLILGAIFITGAIFRMSVGEGRITRLWQAPDFWEQLYWNAASLVVGPVTSIWLTLWRPETAIKGMSLDVGVLAALVFFLSLFLLWREPLPPLAPATLPPTHHQGQPGIWGKFLLPESLRQPLKIGLAALILISVSYGMSFYHFPYDKYALSGHNSGSTHVAATFGVALLGSSLGTILLRWAEAHHKKIWVALLLAAYFSLIAGFHVVVQKDYARGWSSQRQLWGNVLQLSPDISEGTLILLEDAGGLLYPPHILIHSWNHEVTLESIFRFPKAWQKPPRLIKVNKDWKQKAFVQGNNIMWGEVTGWIFGSQWIVLPPNNVILLKASPSGLVRVEDSIELDGREFPLKKLGKNTLEQFPHTPIFDLLLRPQ